MTQGVKGKVIGGDITETRNEVEVEVEDESREPSTSRSPKKYGSFLQRFRKA